MADNRMRGTRHHRTTRGFTLIEVMISLFVFALLTVIFASSLILGKASSKMNGQYAQAISLCQHKIDQLRAVGYGRLNYTELDDAEIVDPSPTSSPYSFVVVDEVANYLPGPSHTQGPTATLTIANHPTDTRVKAITVSISWRASPTRTANSTVTLRAYIANAD
jgi:prepilin-type N-terminal cleavage/methylation domain-containing protein